ncbi:YceI family protein [Winogradskyella sp.]
MNNIKYFLILIFCIGSFYAFKSPDFKTFKAFLTSESELVIKGHSNVNSFQCQYDITELSDPITISYKMVGDNLSFSKAKLELNTLSFNCGHKGINKDFKKLLKSDEFPKISIDLISAENRINDSELFVMVEITICGITKPYKVLIQVEKRNDDLLVCGTLPLDISDFQLEPPKKMLGLVKVSNEIVIDFSLVVVKN